MSIASFGIKTPFLALVNYGSFTSVYRGVSMFYGGEFSRKVSTEGVAVFLQSWLPNFELSKSFVS